MKYTTKLIRLFYLIAILSISSVYGQTSRDSIVCLSSRQVKLINIAFNELERMTTIRQAQDSLLGTKDAKIAILTETEQVRAEQVISLNTDLSKKEKEIKRLKRIIFVQKVVTIGTIIATIYIFR